MSEPNLPTLRAALREHRLSNRITYAELSEATGLTELTLLNFLKARTNPHDSTVYAVEQYLKAQGVQVAA